MGLLPKPRGAPIFWALLVLTLPVGPFLLSNPGRVFLIRLMHDTHGLDVPEMSFPELDPSPSWEPYAIDADARVVRKFDGPGLQKWSRRLDGRLSWFREPHVVWDAKRAYVTQEDGVTALDAESGGILWHSPGPNERLCLSDVLLASGFEKDLGCRVMARNPATGEAVFNVRLETDSEPRGVRWINGKILVDGDHFPDDKGATYLLDRAGKVCRRFDRQVITGIQRGQDEIFLTSDDVQCFAPDGRLRWRLPFQYPVWVAGGGLAEAGEDLLFYLHGRISDSGVEVMRVDVRRGAMVWQTVCPGLRVEHSEYSHRARIVNLDDKFLQVLSRGSKGSFLEALYLPSGRSVLRKETRR